MYDDDSGQGQGFELLTLVTDTAQDVGREFVSSAEDVACDVWQTVLPPPIQQGLRLYRQPPWSDLLRAGTLTLPSLVPLMLLPVSSVLSIFFLPMVIALTIARLSWEVFVNCGRVTTTLQREATAALQALRLVGPSTPQGRALRTVLTLAGQGAVVEAYDAAWPVADTLLQKLESGRNLEPGELLQAAILAAQLLGDPELQAKVAATEEELEDLERSLAVIMGEEGVPVAEDATTTSGESVLSIQSGAETEPVRTPQPVSRRKASSVRRREGRDPARVQAARERAAAKVAARRESEDGDGSGLVKAVLVGTAVVGTGATLYGLATRGGKK